VQSETDGSNNFIEDIWTHYGVALDDRLKAETKVRKLEIRKVKTQEQKEEK
jgi:hypothetical protein